MSSPCTNAKPGSTGKICPGLLMRSRVAQLVHGRMAVLHRQRHTLCAHMPQPPTWPTRYRVHEVSSLKNRATRALNSVFGTQDAARHAVQAALRKTDTALVYDAACKPHLWQNARLSSQKWRAIAARRKSSIDPTATTESILRAQRPVFSTSRTRGKVPKHVHPKLNCDRSSTTFSIWQRKNARQTLAYKLACI